MFKVYLLLGANLGDKKSNLLKAIDLISNKIGGIVAQSSFYKTKAWGKTNQPDFLNIAVVSETKLSANEVLSEIQNIEYSLGRVREEHWGARTMDIDIIFFDEKLINQVDLVVPHPLLTERKFVLAPLNEIIPDFEHPLLKKTIKSLYLSCEDEIKVERI